MRSGSALCLLVLSCGGRVSNPDASIDAGDPFPVCREFRAPSACAFTAPVVLASTERAVFRFALDDEWIYWSEPGAKTIRRVSKTGGASMAIAATVDVASSLVVDNANVYFRALDDIRSVPKNGGDPIVVSAPVRNSSGLAFDNTRLFFGTAAGVMSVPKT